MTRNVVFIYAAFGLVVAGALWESWASRPLQEAPAEAVAIAAPAGRSDLERPAAVKSALPPPLPFSPAAFLAADTGKPVPLGSGELPSFELDRQGNLVVNGHTRHELERLLALNDRGAALALLQQTATALPIAAYRQAADAFYAYQNYTMALQQAFPPGQSPTDEAAAVQQLSTLQALRVQQFGAETAQAYFGEEEGDARRMLADMQAHLTPDSTLEERAEQAQQRVPLPIREADNGSQKTVSRGQYPW